jgi:hypothetical protein
MMNNDLREFKGNGQLAPLTRSVPRDLCPLNKQ